MGSLRTLLALLLLLAVLLGTGACTWSGHCSSELIVHSPTQKLELEPPETPQ